MTAGALTDLGLRERKKAETRRLIATVALRLASERGPDVVTVEDIAEAADVSPRTVFNHFGTKDEAILGVDPDRRAALVSAVAARPSTEAPLQAIANVFIDAMSGDDDAAEFWLARAELVGRHSHLRAAQLSSQAQLESDMAAVIAARTGRDLDRDPYPTLLVTVALSALRVILTRSARAGHRKLRRELEDAFALLARGLDPSPPGKP